MAPQARQDVSPRRGVNDISPQWLDRKDDVSLPITTASAPASQTDGYNTFNSSNEGMTHTSARHGASRNASQDQTSISIGGDDGSESTAHSLPGGDTDGCMSALSSLVGKREEEEYQINPRVISDAILGLSDGLTVPFALSAGLSSFGNARVVVLGSLAELVAGAISMGLGGYVGAKSEACVFVDIPNRSYRIEMVTSY